MLIRGFGLCPTELAKEEPKAAIAALKVAWKHLAKEQHPDVAPEEKKVEAAQRFVQLQSQLEEAVGLLDAGIRPGQAFSGVAYPHWQQQRSDDTARPTYTPPAWDKAPQPFQHREQPKFDLQTRIKGHFVLWTSLFLFLTGFREFLVWSAGSTYAWSPPSDFNPFWVRRFQDSWHQDHKEKEAAPKKPELAKVIAERAKTKRDVPTFYQKRGISTAKRKTEPRGLGTSL